MRLEFLLFMRHKNSVHCLNMRFERMYNSKIANEIQLLVEDENVRRENSCKCIRHWSEANSGRHNIAG